MCVCVFLALCLICCIHLPSQSFFLSSQTCSSEKKSSPNFLLTTVFPSDLSISYTVFLERESVCWGGTEGGGRNNILYLSERKQSRSGALSCDTNKTVRSQSGKIKRCSTDTKQQTQHSQQTGVLLIVPSTKLKFLQLL